VSKNGLTSEVQRPVARTQRWQSRRSAGFAAAHG
jgi:hypothetical protein